MAEASDASDSSTNNLLKPRVRFAPSPTGSLHVGGARTALFNYLFARSNGGTFVLRIEDTDLNRSTEASTIQVLESMAWMGLDWDEGPDKEGDCGPYYQSKRLHIYNDFFEKLLEKNLIYPCFCSGEELEKSKKQMEILGKPPVYNKRCLGLSKEEVTKKLSQNVPHAYRFLVEQKKVVFSDLVKGNIAFDTSLIGDFIVKKSDGFPTYNFAVVTDDASMRISHVIRGDDHISNTPRQILLYEALGFPLPVFAHVSTILGENREKLSKRHGATSLLEFKKDGYYSDAFVNHLALLGWSPEDGEEIIPREKLLRSFTKTKFTASPAIFDYKKLDFLNAHYLRNLDENVVYNDFAPYLKNAGFDEKDAYVKKVALTVKNYCKKLSEITDHMKLFFEENITIEAAHKTLMDDKQTDLLIDFCADFFSKLKEDFVNEEDFSKLASVVKTEMNIGGKKFFLPLRLKLTGQSSGLEMKVIFDLFSRKKIIEKLKKSNVYC